MENHKSTMKAWQRQGPGLDNIKRVELPVPTAGLGQILVKVKAVSLNYRDKAIADGIYLPHLMTEPFIPVSDAAGEVVAIGDKVTKFKAGDRVISHMFTEWLDGAPNQDYGPSALGGPKDGGLAEYLLLEEEATVKAPDYMTYEEAASLPIAALTVWFSLVEYGKIKAGDTVLVLGTGGVSVSAVQIAAALGARVIATSSSNAKAEKIKSLGATDVINYVENPDWEKNVLELTNGEGVQHILEVVGGDSLNKSLEAVALQGNIYIIGFLKNMMAEVNLFTLLAKRVRVQGINVGHRKALEDVVKAFQQLKIQPVIDKVYPFEDALKAYEHLNQGAFGKIVIQVN